VEEERGAGDRPTLPVMDGKAVPVITRGQWARIPEAWLRNAHRRGRAEAGAEG
jgi:hypothetical protein